MTYRLTTSTHAGRITGVAVVVLALALFALPAVAPRAVIQDLFTILTLLTLAQIWNLLAGYGGLVSVGQQAFVGIGAYALFAGVILLGWNPVPAILLGGLAALALAVPTAFFAFRLQGAYFAIGTWVIAEVTRLLVAQWKTSAAAPEPRCRARRRPTSSASISSARSSACARRRRATSSPTGSR